MISTGLYFPLLGWGYNQSQEDRLKTQHHKVCSGIFTSYIPVCVSLPALVSSSVYARMFWGEETNTIMLH